MLLAGPVSGAVLGAAALYASTREDADVVDGSQSPSLEEMGAATREWTAGMC